MRGRADARVCPGAQTAAATQMGVIMRYSEKRNQTDPFLKSFLTGLLPEAEPGKHRHPARNHKPQATDSRTALSRVGSTDLGRESMRCLLESVQLAKEADGDAQLWLELANRVGADFDQQDAAAALKEELFGRPRSREPNQEKELAILQALLSTATPSAFSLRSLGVRARVEALAHVDPKAALGVLTAASLPQGKRAPDEYLAGLARGLQAAHAVTLWKDHRAILEELVEHNPGLALVPEAWATSTERRRALFLALERLTLSAADLTTLGLTLDKVAVLGREHFARDLGERVAQALAVRIFDRDSVELADASYRFLAQFPQAVLNALRGATCSPRRVLRLARRLLDPESQAVQGFGAGLWLDLAENARWLELDDEERSDLGSVLLLAAFFDKGERGAALAASSFQVVHDYAEQNRLPLNAWHRLEHHLPQLWWDWDKCERLRRARNGRHGHSWRRHLDRSSNDAVGTRTCDDRNLHGRRSAEGDTGPHVD